jgi:hypothetical protein
MFCGKQYAALQYAVHSAANAPRKDEDADVSKKASTAPTKHCIEESFSVATLFTVLTVRGGNHPRGMSLATRLSLYTSRRWEPMASLSVDFCRKRAPCLLGTGGESHQDWSTLASAATAQSREQSDACAGTCVD